jgi:hypothetical protein
LRRWRRERGCWSCRNRNKRPRSAGSALSLRVDRRLRTASSPLPMLTHVLRVRRP